MTYCINRTVSKGSDPFVVLWSAKGFVLYYFESSETRKKMLADRVEENEDEEVDDGCFGGWRRVCGGGRRVQTGRVLEHAHASGRPAL